MSDRTTFQIYSGELDAVETGRKTTHQLAGLHKEALRGNTKAWEDLWLHGTKIVLKIVNKLHTMDLLRCSFDDAVAEGNLAIGEALTKWNPKKSTFSTWVWIRVRGSVLNLSEREHNHGMPGSTEDRPTVVGEDVSVDMGDNPNLGNKLYDLVDHGLSYGRDPRILAEDAELHQSMTELPERELRFLTMHHFEDMSLQEIADLEGISKVRVHQIVKRAEELMKEKT